MDGVKLPRSTSPAGTLESLAKQRQDSTREQTAPPLLQCKWDDLQAVGGNTALALLLTVGSNLVGICTMPFVLCAVLGAGRGAVQIAPGPLLRSLVRTILTPLLAGAAARAFIPGPRPPRGVCLFHSRCGMWSGGNRFGRDFSVTIK